MRARWLLTPWKSEMYLKMSCTTRSSGRQHGSSERDEERRTHLGPLLLAATAPPVGQVLLVSSAARARVVGREHDLHVLEREEAAVDALLERRERAKDDVVGLGRELELNVAVVLGPAHTHKPVQRESLRERERRGRGVTAAHLRIQKLGKSEVTRAMARLRPSARSSSVASAVWAYLSGRLTRSSLRAGARREQTRLGEARERKREDGGDAPLPVGADTTRSGPVEHTPELLELVLHRRARQAVAQARGELVHGLRRRRLAVLDPVRLVDDDDGEGARRELADLVPDRLDAGDDCESKVGHELATCAAARTGRRSRNAPTSRTPRSNFCSMSFFFSLEPMKTPTSK